MKKLLILLITITLMACNSGATEMNGKLNDLNNRIALLNELLKNTNINITTAGQQIAIQLKVIAEILKKLPIPMQTQFLASLPEDEKALILSEMNKIIN